MIFHSKRPGQNTLQDIRPYFAYYHNDRTHLSLEKDSPDSRPIQPRPAGKCKIIALPQIGGLHHRYEWKKAA